MTFAELLVTIFNHLVKGAEFLEVRYAIDNLGLVVWSEILMHVSNFLVCVSYIYSVLYVYVYWLSVEIHVKEPALCICNIKM